MKIALIGYGKMGQTIEKIAQKRGHEIVLIFDKGQKDYNIIIADVAIEFTMPGAQSTTLKIVSKIKSQLFVEQPVGWILHEVKKECLDKMCFLYA